jgi:hypothetical protein
MNEIRIGEHDILSILKPAGIGVTETERASFS